MSLLVIGSVALDTIETPFAKGKNLVGGSAIDASLAGSFFTRCAILACVGKDFPDEFLRYLARKNIDTSLLQVCEGKTFSWDGYYDTNLNVAHTRKTELNVFERFKPVLDSARRSFDAVLLANIDPSLQKLVIRQIATTKIVAADTMNYWIENRLSQLRDLIRKVDILFVNEHEAKMLGGHHNIVKATRDILRIGVKTLVVKRGEYGSVLIHDKKVSMLPAFLLETPVDPTGAGDSFAGAFLGYLDTVQKPTFAALKQALFYATVVSSFTVARLGARGLTELNKNAIRNRLKKLKTMVS